MDSTQDQLDDSQINDIEESKEEEDQAKEEQKKLRKTKTEMVVMEFSKKIEEVEAKYKMVPIMEKKRSISVSGTRPVNYENNFFT